MSVEIDPSNRNAVFSVAIANELGTPVRSGFARRDAVRAALGIPNIIEYRVAIPSARVPTLSSDSFELEGLSGSFAIISGLVYLPSEAVESLSNVVAFSIVNGEGDVIFKSGPISSLDPGNISFVSSVPAQTNIPATSGRFLLSTTDDSSTDPESDLIVLLYLIDFSSKL